MSTRVCIVIPSLNDRIREVLAGCGYQLVSRAIGPLGGQDGIDIVARPEPTFGLVNGGSFDAGIEELHEGERSVDCDFASGTFREHTPFEELGPRLHRGPHLKDPAKRKLVNRLQQQIISFLQAERAVTMRFTLPADIKLPYQLQRLLVNQSEREVTVRVPFTALGGVFVDLANLNISAAVWGDPGIAGRYRFS